MVLLGRTANGWTEWKDEQGRTLRQLQEIAQEDQVDVDSNGSQQIVQKLWNYCNILRDDGLSYGDYVEQLTYLLFLKMAHERTQPPYNQPPPSRPATTGPVCSARTATPWRPLPAHPGGTGQGAGMLGVIFRKAQNKIQDPAKLRRLIVDLIDRERWTSSTPTSRAMPTRGCWRRTRRTPRAAPGSTSRRAR